MKLIASIAGHNDMKHINIMISEPEKKKQWMKFLMWNSIENFWELGSIKRLFKFPAERFKLILMDRDSIAKKLGED
jgi:hypothetical protein